MVIPLEDFRHSVVRSECEAARDSGGQVKIRSVEEHFCVADAILGHLKIVRRPAVRLGGQQSGYIVRMTGGALPAAFEFTAPLKSSPQIVEDHQLVLKCPAGIDDGRVADAEVLAGEIVHNEWPHDHWSVRVKRGYQPGCLSACDNGTSLSQSA